MRCGPALIAAHPEAAALTLGVCLPLRNAGADALRLAAALRQQTLSPDRLLVVDSGSTDGSAAPFLALGAEVMAVAADAFDHGGSRRRAVEWLADCDVLLFLTQDAIPADPRSCERLVMALLAHEDCGAVYGRQLPRPGAGEGEAYARRFNYPPESAVKTAADIPRLGIKTAFISNSFAVYRREALTAVGGFPERMIVSEDTWVAARMLLAGWSVAYCAAAEVFHSHGYTLRQEWRRYFDIGVFHARQPWLRAAFGGAEGEGLRFLRRELAQAHPLVLPSILWRCTVRFLAFRAGLLEAWLPLALKRQLSAQKAFWNQES